MNNSTTTSGATVATSVVYFIQSGSGPVKIGRATSVSMRVIALQSASPYKLSVRAMLPGRETLKAALHQQFALARVRGEWFDPEQEDLDRFVENAFTRLVQHVLPSNPVLAGKLIETGYVPHGYIDDTQKAVGSLTDELIAEVPDPPPLKRNKYPFGHPDERDRCRCGGPKLVRSKRCKACWIAEQGRYDMIF